MRLFAAMLALSLSLPLAAAPLRVTGRVFDWAKESGVAGARVELLPAYEGPIRPAPLASARTDAEGFFEIAAPESGCFLLVVRAEGYLTMEHPLVPLVEERHLPTANLMPSRSLEAAGEEVRRSRRALGSDRPWGWRLAERLPGKNETPKAAAASKPMPPRRISGKVTDSASGKPVAGALVWSGWPLVAPPARTDAEGRFQLDLPGGPPGEGVWLESGAAGFLPAERRYTRPGAEPVLLKLDPAAEISGKVSDQAGQPVAGASVQVTPPRAIDQVEDFSGAWVGPDGRFRLTGLKPGSAYKLTARRKSFEKTTVPARTAPVGQPPPPPVQIVLGTGKTAFGRVVDAAGRPAAEVKIVLFQQTYLDQQEATTNKEGRFEIRHLSPGTYMLTAYHPERTGLEMLAVEIPPAPPSVDLGDLKLPADGAIEGRVTDSRGKPVEGAEVDITAANELGFGGSLNLSGGDWEGQPGLRSVRTGPDGSFRAPGLKIGESFDVRARHPDHAEATVAGVEVPTREPVRIELKSGHRLTGRVVDTQGEPVAGASLTWLERGQGIAGFFGSPRPLGVTDSEGRFQASGLPAGGLDLEVSAKGYQSRLMEGLRIPDAGDLEDVRIVLGEGSWLDVQVRNADGEPVPDVTMIAEPQDLDEQNPLTMLRALRSLGDCDTDSQGRCRLDLPEPGSYTVQIMTGAARVNVTAGPGGTPVDIRLPRGFEVSGRVIGKDGAGVPEALVQSLSEALQPGLATTGDDGSFSFDLVDGRHRLTVQQPGVGMAALEVEVAGQPVRGLELRLAETEPTAVLTGRLTGLPPQDLKGAAVQAQAQELFETGLVQPDVAYRIEDLKPGEWTVTAHTESGREAHGQVRIEEGATAATLDLDFTSGLTLTGRVLVDGSPHGGASVLAGNRDDKGSGRHSRTAYDGSFTLRDLPAGSLVLLVFGAPGISAKRELQLEESGEITVEITTGTFKATVLSATGEPLEGAVATLAPWDPDPELQVPFAAVSARSGPDGTLDAGRLAPGTYRMEVRKEGFQPRQENVEIRPDGGTVMEVRLAPRE